MEVSFKIEGSYITNFARQKFFVQNKPFEAIELLLSCLQTEEISDDERLILALKVINSNLDIVGTYPSDNYGLKETGNNTPLLEVFKHLNTFNDKLEAAKTEIREWQEKFLFLADHIADDGEWALKEVNRKYKNLNGTELFELGEEENEETSLSSFSMVDSFLKRMKSENPDGDYGWLEPDGTFHSVDWCEHDKWASEWLEKNKPFPENAELYWIDNTNGDRQHICGGDVLVYKLHWVLLHNPYQGIAMPKYDMTYGMTKAQKEFLYDYYIERELHDEANALYKE